MLGPFILSMDSVDISPEIKRLTYKVVKAMIDRTNRNLQRPVVFLEVYQEACIGGNPVDDQYDKSNLGLKQLVRDNLLRNGYIFVNPNDIESVFITETAVKQYDLLPEEKW